MTKCHLCTIVSMDVNSCEPMYDDEEGEHSKIIDHFSNSKLIAISVLSGNGEILAETYETTYPQCFNERTEYRHRTRRSPDYTEDELSDIIYGNFDSDLIYGEQMRNPSWFSEQYSDSEDGYDSSATEKTTVVTEKTTVSCKSSSNPNGTVCDAAYYLKKKGFLGGSQRTTLKVN